MDSPDQLLTPADAAARLGCSRGHVYNLIAVGDLAAVEIRTSGSKRAKTRITEADLKAFIDSRSRRATTPARLIGTG